MIGYTEFRDSLREALSKKIESLDYSECTLESYDKDNWAYRQAHKNGYRSCARQFLKLIDTLDKKDTDDQSIRANTGRPT